MRTLRIEHLNSYPITVFKQVFAAAHDAVGSDNCTGTRMAVHIELIAKNRRLSVISGITPSPTHAWVQPGLFW
ncbi:hypothetical protein AG1IA_06019 [Rhizoctonia solani AG-1 IA]|uniref:Uncharacterized protein n=1 Tax=Thanatephorus cucumeris (strain AG1-IA) TaxID=983506 RepID=L8WPN0_THACA|nr:hypothetical protein AG1IA_06019 [Rhizoctonia solani AG-1 IA]